jgi:hypothetical protein
VRESEADGTFSLSAIVSRWARERWRRNEDPVPGQSSFGTQVLSLSGSRDDLAVVIAAKLAE